MSELDVPPWQQQETVPATTQWLDEGPFAAGIDAVPVTESPFGAELGAALEAIGVAGEGEVPGCGQVPVGPRPLLLRGTGTTSSRNPSVGYAQTLLNVFLASLRVGSPSCNDTRTSTQQYIRSLHGLLVSLKQDPLAVDCMFGQATEAATKMFQACRMLVRDGKIGDRTWPELERLANGRPAPPVPVPPVPAPPVTPGVRVREDVWRLSAADPWHPTLLWYARGVRSLQARNGSNFADPRSWRHLAETHGTIMPRSQWPPGAKWDSCEHGSWHFLTWHRVYVHHFERIMRDEIGTLGGPSDWALPFWNYSDDSRPDVRRIPPAFRAASLPDGTPNPLRVEARARGVNTGSPIAKEAVDTTEAFGETGFTLGFAGGFGGRSARVGTHNGTAGGVLERIPHGAVHIEVGGPRGLMSEFVTAAQDPIFWLHHANIDRLWEAWLRTRSTNRNPPEAAWLSASFTFGSGSTTTTLTTAQVVDPRQAPLGYRYSDMPVTPTPEAFAERPDEVPEFIGEDETRPPELVGASVGPVPLGGQATTAQVDVSAPTGPVAREMEGGAPPANARVYLRLENITGTKVHTSGVEVYVNVPAGGRPADFPDRRAGLAAMFGVIEASRRTSTHSGSGLDVTFDITRIVRALSAGGAWDPKRLQVTFVPLPDATGQVGQGDVQVGRVSLFYA
jgi:tyrosinase-like protein